MFPTGQSQDLLGQTGTGCPVVPVSRDKKNPCPIIPLSNSQNFDYCRYWRGQSREFRVSKKQQDLWYVASRSVSLQIHSFEFRSNFFEICEFYEDSHTPRGCISWILTGSFMLHIFFEEPKPCNLRPCHNFIHSKDSSSANDWCHWNNPWPY